MSCFTKLQLYLKLRKCTLTFSAIAGYFSAPRLLSYCEFNKVFMLACLCKIAFHRNHGTQQGKSGLVNVVLVRNAKSIIKSYFFICLEETFWDFS